MNFRKVLKTGVECILCSRWYSVLKSILWETLINRPTSLEKFYLWIFIIDGQVILKLQDIEQQLSEFYHWDIYIYIQKI